MINEERMAKLNDFIKGLSKEERVKELKYVNDYISTKLKDKQPSI